MVSAFGDYTALRRETDHKKYAPMTIQERFGESLCKDGGGEPLKSAIFDLYQVRVCQLPFLSGPSLVQTSFGAEGPRGPGPQEPKRSSAQGAPRPKGPKGLFHPSIMANGPRGIPTPPHGEMHPK